MTSVGVAQFDGCHHTATKILSVNENEVTIASLLLPAGRYSRNRSLLFLRVMRFFSLRKIVKAALLLGRRR
jgi:hypothetical protein